MLCTDFSVVLMMLIDLQYRTSKHLISQMDRWTQANPYSLLSNFTVRSHWCEVTVHFVGAVRGAARNSWPSDSQGP